MHELRRLALSILLSIMAAPVLAATHTVTHERQLPAARGALVEFENLVGSLRLSRAPGDTVEVTARVVAGGDSDEKARRLAESIELVTAARGGRLTVHVEYPLDEYRTYIYQPEGRGGHSRTSTRYRGERIQITSGHRSGGARLYVDVDIALPEGVDLSGEQAAGDISATGLASDLALGIGSGRILLEDTSGSLDLDTGSGSIEVVGHEGKVRADTGSGSVELRRIRGDVVADTGSGSIRLEEVRAGSIDVDTGSGGIRIRDASGSLRADTGSGSIEAEGFIAGPRVDVDTGSGGVRLAGDLSGVEDLDISTGSGGVVLRTTHLPSWALVVDVGSGRIRVDLPGMEEVEQDDDWFRAKVGGGEGRARIDTGSGGARIEILD